MSQERYTVECLSGGQPRPYADARHHYRVTVEWQGVIRSNETAKDKPFIPRPELAEAYVKPILRALVRGWDDEPGGYGRRLERCEMISPGVWDIVVVEPFTD